MPNPRRYFRAKAFDHGELIARPKYEFLSAAIATMLLAVFMAMTFRVQTHAILMNLPPLVPTDEAVLQDIQVNEISITENGIVLWNGEPVTSSQLLRRLQDTMVGPVEPGLIFEPDANASYDIAIRVLSIVKSSGVTKFCFGGTTQYRQFGKSDGDARIILPRDEYLECDPQRQSWIWMPH